MKRLILISILSFSFQFLFAQEAIKNDSLITIIKDSRIDKMNKTYSSTFKLKGYRIQIFSGNQRKPANQARLTFRRIYSDVKAHESYDQPYFKVRAGDFRTKMEALKFKKDLIKHFPNCFIVKDNIDIEELTN